jgi:hypothetical protein
MDAAHPSSMSTPIPSPAPLPAFNTIPVGGIFRAMEDSLVQDVISMKKPKVESLDNNDGAASSFVLLHWQLMFYCLSYNRIRL